MSEAEFTDLPPSYRAAVNTIKNIIDGGEALITAVELPEGPGSKVGLEKYAREYCKVHSSMDLGIQYGLLGVVTCAAAQGGFVIHAPIHGGGILKVPAVQYIFGVAASGWGKSTAIDAGAIPLTRVLAAGREARRVALPGIKQQAMDHFNATIGSQVVPPLTANDEQFKMVYDAGLCPKTMTQDATQEAMRNQAVANGGHVSVLAGEPDMLTNVGQYTKSGEGSLTLFLNMWDQREIDTTRVSNTDLFIEEASLAMAVLFQTAKFAEVTSGNQHGMGSGADSYTDKGMFGRAFVVQTDKTGDQREIALAYSDDADLQLDPQDPDGYRDATGHTTDLGAAALDFEMALRSAQMDSNDYRMDKAIHRAWDMALYKYGTDLQVPEPNQATRTVFHLEGDARIAYFRTQRMMAEIKDYVDNHEDEENKNLWNPMASRIVQHILREALVMTLAAGSRQVTGEFIEDAATRIFPWRWCMSANALTRRASERAEDMLTDAVLNYNPQKKEITKTSMIADILGVIAADDKRLAEPGLTFSALRDKVRSRLSRQHRPLASQMLKDALAELTAEPTSGVDLVEHETAVGGKSVKLYRVRGPVILR